MNADALCRRCHAFFEDKKGVDRFEHSGKTVESPQAYREWKIKQLGPVRFAALEVHAATHVKKDRKLALIVVKALIAEWERRPENRVLGRKA